MSKNFSIFCVAMLTALSTSAWAQTCNGSGGACESSQVADNKMTKDIVATAESAGQFKTLIAALKAAGLDEVLKGKGPFTVFAPNDAAFAKLPKGTVEGLLKDKAKLKSILTYHVVGGKLGAKDVLGGAELKTVNGQTLTAKKVGKDVMLDAAKVIKTDIECSNGVIHVIDCVVLPK
jgi:uncharacterized surface protein with fasciclin (FAS1) repeats